MQKIFDYLSNSRYNIGNCAKGKIIVEREKIMDTATDLELKDRKYMPVFPRASGNPTDYIDGYPYDDGKPMSTTIPHSMQLQTFFGQLLRYFAINDYVLVGADNFIYYREGDPTKCVAPDVFVVFGVEKAVSRRSFYTWAEGAVPAAVFEFLSDSTADYDRNEKVRLYLMDMGVSECFIHQPHLSEPAEFHGWRRSRSGGIVEIAPDEQGALFSETLNLRFQWEIDQPQNVRLLRPYLPDGTPIPTDIEEQHLREAAQAQAEEAQAQAEEAQAQAEEAQVQAEEEQHLRIEEQRLRIEEQRLREAAQARAEAEAQRRQEAEAELEQLRAQLANRQNEGS